MEDEIRILVFWPISLLGFRESLHEPTISKLVGLLCGW